MFDFFSSVAPLPIDTKLFCLYLIFISSTVQRNHGVENKNVNFLLRKSPQAHKMYFFKFFGLLHIYPSRRNFLVFTNLPYLQPFREIMGDKKTLQTTNNKQTTTKTTNKHQTNNKQMNTTNDHNTPSGFFQNPRANKGVDYDFGIFNTKFKFQSLFS